jgi:hypothetical protein
MSIIYALGIIAYLPPANALQMLGGKAYVGFTLFHHYMGDRTD